MTADQHRCPSSVVSERAERSATTDRLLARISEESAPPVRESMLEEVIVANRGVAEAVANRYRGRGVPIDDLYQVAYEGLVKAVRRFDPELENDLLTYAVPTIRGQLQRYFRDLGWTVRPPRRVQELQWELNLAIERLTAELGRDPSDEELMTELDVPPAEYREAITAFGCFRPASLDQPVGEWESTTRGELIPGGDDPTEAVELRLSLKDAIGELSARERWMLYLRFFEDRTQVEIADEIGVTQMQVSRLLARLFTQLRGRVTADERDRVIRSAPPRHGSTCRQAPAAG